jgi:putative transposase
MAAHPSGYYAWLENPDSARSIEDKRLLGHIKLSWLESNSVYDYRKVTDDLRDPGETCGKHRAYRLMRQKKLGSQTSYRRRNSHRGGPAAVTAPNHLQRHFAVVEPNRVWVTDITYIRTYEGWLFLAVVIDLFSRQVIGGSMGPRMDRELATNALLMAVYRRQPQSTVLVYSDQGSQFSSYDWQAFLKAHNLQPSMSRRGNCHDNAVAESFFSVVKT